MAVTITNDNDNARRAKAAEWMEALDASWYQHVLRKVAELYPAEFVDAAQTAVTDNAMELASRPRTN